MQFAIDYDGTWSAHPECSRDLAELLASHNHDLVVITNRDASQPIPDLGMPIPVVYAGRELKEEAAIKAGYKVNIWIDDMPGTIQRCLFLEGADEEL